MDRQELINKCNLLSGNINRMMVTDSQDELMSMFTYAVDRINKIYWENKKRINMQEYQKGQEDAD